MTILMKDILTLYTVTGIQTDVFVWCLVFGFYIFLFTCVPHIHTLSFPAAILYVYHTYIYIYSLFCPVLFLFCSAPTAEVPSGSTVDCYYLNAYGKSDDSDYSLIVSRLAFFIVFEVWLYYFERNSKLEHICYFISCYCSRLPIIIHI